MDYARARQILAIVAIGVITLPVMTACGGEDAPAATPTAAAPPTAAPTSTVAISGPLALGAIVWASSIDPVSSEPVGTAASYASTAGALIAAIPVTNALSGTVLTAYWSYNDTLMAKMTTVAVIEQDASSVWVSFRLSAPGDERWPAGTYDVEIVVNSTTRAAAAIEVTD